MLKGTNASLYLNLLSISTHLVKAFTPPVLVVGLSAIVCWQRTDLLAPPKAPYIITDCTALCAYQVFASLACLWLPEGFMLRSLKDWIVHGQLLLRNACPNEPRRYRF